MWLRTLRFKMLKVYTFCAEFEVVLRRVGKAIHQRSKKRTEFARQTQKSAAQSAAGAKNRATSNSTLDACPGANGSTQTAS